MPNLESLARLGCSEAALKKAIASKPVVVVCTTQRGCPHCHDMKGVLREVTRGRSDVRILEVDSGDRRCADLTEKIQEIPVTAFYANGKMKTTLIGSRPAQDVRKVLDGATTVAGSGGACRVGGSAADRLACVAKR